MTIRDRVLAEIVGSAKPLRASWIARRLGLAQRQVEAALCHHSALRRVEPVDAGAWVAVST